MLICFFRERNSDFTHQATNEEIAKHGIIKREQIEPNPITVSKMFFAELISQSICQITGTIQPINIT